MIGPSYYIRYFHQPERRIISHFGRKAKSCKQRRIFWASVRRCKYDVTYSMVQSPSWETNWFADSQEILRISPNPKVHYLTHKRPPPVSILGQPNPVHIPTSHLLEIRPNIIHPSTPRPPQWSISLQFPHQEPIHPPLHIEIFRR